MEKAKAFAEDPALEEELRWITDMEKSNSSLKGRTWEKLSSNPIVPLGALATIGVLGNGIFNFYKGNQRKQQIMMRLRCLAQGVTIIAAFGGVIISGKFLK